MNVLRIRLIGIVWLMFGIALLYGNPNPVSGQHSPHSKFHIPNLQSKSAPDKQTATIMENGVSVPSNYPHVYITVNDNPDTGLIFITTSWNSYPQYSMILNNTGAPIWYMRTGNEERRDFKVQPNGWATILIRGGYGGSGEGFIAFDEQYNPVHTFRADPVYDSPNNYWTDEHELQVLADGGYLLIGRRRVSVNMSDHISKDNRTVSVLESCIQEFDANDNLANIYPAIDYFNPADLWPEELQKSYDIRFPHMNAIDIDNDGHIILSSCYIDEITKINRQTKEIIWRLGGAHSYFKFVKDSLDGFTGQHSVRVVGNNRYLLFDNGNHHDPPVSRAVEYELDLSDSTATLVWEFRDTPDKYSHYMGNVQRLPNGNTLINWAVSEHPKLTEVRPDCTKAFEMNFVFQDQSYRVHRCQWEGKAEKPCLVLESHREAVVLIFNQFGDPNVDYYRIYGGTSPNPTTPLDTSKVTMKTLTNLQNHTRYYFQVTAVDIYGQESGFSNEENTTTNFITPGSNMVLNGGFSNQRANWTFITQQLASADWSVEDGISHISILQGGNSLDQILLVQDGMEVIRGEQYLFEFDAWSNIQRTIEAVIIQYGGQFTNYSRTGPSLLTAKPTHYSYPFTMEDPSDFNAYLAFLMGTLNGDVYLDNISFKRITGSDVAENLSRTPIQYELTGNYPNPFNAQTNICFSVPQKSRVRIQLYNILGKLEQELCNAVFEQGAHQIKFSANRLGSGIYFCSMEAKGMHSTQIHRDVHKITLIK